jgi:hypothetical protein
LTIVESFLIGGVAFFLFGWSRLETFSIPFHTNVDLNCV